MSCIKPSAPFGETTQGRKPDSWRATSRTTSDATPFFPAALSIISDSSGCAIGSHWNMMDGVSTGADAVGGVQGNIDTPAVLACLCTEARCCASDDSMAARARSAWFPVSCIRMSASHNVTFFLSARAWGGVSQIKLT
jgi:hypothetical protein